MTATELNQRIFGVSKEIEDLYYNNPIVHRAVIQYCMDEKKSKDEVHILIIKALVQYSKTQEEEIIKLYKRLPITIVANNEIKIKV